MSFMKWLGCAAWLRFIADFNQCFGAVRSPSAGQNLPFSVFFYTFLQDFDAKMRKNEHSFALFPEGYKVSNINPALLFLKYFFNL